MSDIQIRAISSDNDREIRSLISLFKNSAENIAIHLPLDSMSFWQESIGRRFVSLGAFDGDTLIAHLGLKRSSNNESGTELVLPAFAASSIDCMETLGSATVEVLERLSVRQGWDTLSCVAPLSLSKYSKTFAKSLNLKETALIPDSQGAPQAFLFREFKTQAHQASKAEHSEVTVPLSICSLLRTVRKELGLEDLKFIGETDSPSLGRANVELRRWVRLGQSRLQAQVLEPLLADQEPRHSFVNPAHQLFVLPCDQAITTNLMRSLVSKHYVCCGLLPQFHGSNHLLFAQSIAELPSAQDAYFSDLGLHIKKEIEDQIQAKPSVDTNVVDFSFSTTDSTIDDVVGV